MGDILNMAKDFIHQENIPNVKPVKQLKIDKRLPQILIPANKIQLFIDWWNSDIRFETSIPHAFNEGYVVVDNIIVDNTDVSKFRDLIKATASELGTSYRYVENVFKEFLEKSKKITLYFIFLNDNTIYSETYDDENKIMSRMEFAVGKSEAEKEIDLNVRNDIDNIDDLMHDINYVHLALLVTSLWYIATTSRSTKYIYEKKTPQIIGRQKGVVQVSDTKFISTPIYDMSKTRTVKVESLQTRKKGWTYSHSFQVHGHYRHYRNGKVIFIEPYIKGKNKEFKSQTIVVTPDDK